MPQFRQLLLGAAAALAMAHSATAATTFNYTGAINAWIAPTTGVYQIMAWGAQGGSYGDSVSPVTAGGHGAEVGGDVFLTAGATLLIVVGGTPTRGGGNIGDGGGGGTWVFTLGAGPGGTLTDIPLAIAGGGGGAGYGGFFYQGIAFAGHDGQITMGTGLGGVSGDLPCCQGGGGGGWLGNGQDGDTVGNIFVSGHRPYGTGGIGLPSFTGGATVGCYGPESFSCFDYYPTGGFGGGGGAGWNYGGGGGGYTGGDSGNRAADFGGFGGSSYLDAGFTNVVKGAGIRSGNGLVTISDVLRGGPVPELATWVTMLAGFFTTGAALRRRRRWASAGAV
ncbi:MAG: hypothetical protein ACJ798_18960 [Phenylobacterium sp.]